MTDLVPICPQAQARWRKGTCALPSELFRLVHVSRNTHFLLFLISGHSLCRWRDPRGELTSIGCLSRLICCYRSYDINEHAGCERLAADTLLDVNACCTGTQVWTGIRACFLYDLFPQWRSKTQDNSGHPPDHGCALASPLMEGLGLVRQYALSVMRLGCC